MRWEIVEWVWAINRTYGTRPNGSTYSILGFERQEELREDGQKRNDTVEGLLHDVETRAVRLLGKEGNALIRIMATTIH